MKINSQEMLLMNKRNVKFNGEQSKPSSIKEPIQNPEETLNALNLMGQNNIAFQGVGANVLRKAKYAVPTAMLALAALTSCEKMMPPMPQQPIVLPSTKDSVVVNVNVNQETNVNVSVDMSAINSLLDEMKEMKDISAKTYSVLLDLLNEYKDGKVNDNEFYAKWYEWMEKDEAFKGFVVDKLGEQMSAEEAEHFFNAIIGVVKQGQLDSAKAFEIIINELKNGNETLLNIYNAVVASAERAHHDHKELMGAINGSKSSLKDITVLLKEVIRRQDVSIELEARIEENTKKLNEKQDSTNAKLDSLLNDIADMKDILAEKDFAGCDESAVVAYLQARDPKLFALLERLNIKAGNIEELLGGLDNAACECKDYTAWFNKAVDALESILDKLGDLDLTVKENQDKLDAVIEKMDEVCKCECGKDSPNEDIVEDLEDIFG